MFCQNCGAQIEDSAKFCTECGSAVSGRDSPGQPQSPAPVKVEDVPAVTARGEIKKMAKSGLFLTVAILLSFGLLATFGTAANFVNPL